MRPQHLRSHWLTGESAPVYGRKGHLYCALRCPCIYSGNEGADLRPALPKKPSVSASHACSPLPLFAFKRLDGKFLVLHGKRLSARRSSDPAWLEIKVRLRAIADVFCG
jgi:hypothetical protein